uniref:Centrosomal protein 192 n=1 Tax=Anser brachyrhynchus TaxID=132585 RepID=A0A8B9I4L9_9AVES
MEDFRRIADETFPSFLGSSLNSSAGVAFGNVTVSSNPPGLPVAASTVAKSKTGCDNRVNGVFSFVSLDDDIDDEEFFDNQLEAYFEQLIPPEIARGDINVEKLSECCTALKLSENGLLQVSLKWSPKLRIPNVQYLMYLSGDIPHSIVYQNEEGKWVTDLAYYTSFDEEQGLNLSEDDKIDDDFITGSEAAAMIAQDQEEFEKAHRLVQAEKADILNASEIADSSWKSANSCILLRTSELNRDASYLRLSLGEFFGQRSEALGCLGGGSDVKRGKNSTAFLKNIVTNSFGELLSKVFLLKKLYKCVAKRNETRKLVCLSVQDKFEGGLCNHSDSVLSISTIASAIANASCSADPTQLAAMMMALSTKNKKTCFLPGIIKEMELSANHALSNNVENGAFDMEKYLRKTDELGHESEYESVVKHDTSVQNFMTDGSLLSKVKNKDALLEDLLNDQNEQQEIDKRFLDYFHAENDTQNICNPSDVSKHDDRTTDSIKSDFTCTSHYPKSPCKESTLPQSVYSSPSMSRLTYVSASDSTLKNTAVTRDPQTHWSENASALSTTIIRASPTPSQEHANENVEDYLCQRNRKGVLFSVDEKSEENDLAAIKRKLEDEVQGQELSKEGLPKNEKPLASIPSNVAANHRELDPVKSALSSKFCSFEPLSVNVDAEVWQDHTNKAQRQGLPSLNVLPMFPGLRTYIPLNQNSSGEQYIPISSFKPHVATSESQAISSVPTLLTGHSLATTPFVQQHLGNMPPTGSTVLSQFHGCSSAGFGLPAGLPCSTIPAGHVENPVPVGIPLGSNLGPGSLGAASLCNPHSASWNKNILNLKSFAGQPLGTTNRSIFSSEGHVKVPEELKFPNACCVGIASQTALSIFNPTERWLQVSIGILSISVNGEKVDPAKYQCLVFKNKTIIGPHSTDDLKILFLPCHSGIFQCILSISSWPVSADAETIVQAEALASRVVLTAVAENPHLEVETGKQDYLDFGDLTSGSWKALPLKLTNKTHAFVPIRLIINANAVAWRCFTFSKAPVNPPSEQSLQMDTVSQIAAPSVVNHVIHASYDGQDPEALTVWVLFHAPKKQISYPLGPADEFLARVDVELDSLGPSSVIKSIPLRARAGTARIHAPKDLQTIHLSTTVGSTAKQQLPLKNAGNIGVYLKVKTSNQDSCFAVEPGDLFLLPEEEREVTVMFFPKTVIVLKILVLPSGPQYEVVMKGEVESVENRPVSTTASCSDIPPILSNKQFIAWGGVKLGGSVQQKLTLRNNSPSVTQHLRLVIRGQDQDCFQLQSIFGSEERLTSSWELKIRPREDTNIYLMFTPTRVTFFFAKLEIKQLGIRSRPGIKFTIPLSGYGGTSNVILESVKKLSDSYMLTLDGLLPSRLSTVSFRIRNTGSRAAYVKALCFANLQTKTVMDPQVMMVSPEKFVLREGTYKVITVTWNPMEKENNLLRAKTLLSTVCFFCGDEISRQQYLCDIPRGTSDIRLFYANMRKVILTVVGCFVFDRDGFQQSPGRHLESNRSENSVRHINATLDVLPVKGPQGPPLPVKTDDLIQNQVDVQQTWAVKPEHLILTSPSISGTADTGHVQIVNHSNRMLTFELSWPAHCLTITPQHGVIEPESRTLILVSPNPSLATKPSVIPWSGLIYIHCDNGQKFIKVQIREENVQDVPGAGSPSRRRDIFTLQSASPTVHVAKPLSALPLTKMEIKNRSVLFPKTRAGESSESYLEMENKGDENVRWNLSSFTPPYVKDVDGTDSVYRVTYSAFRCYRVSGTLEAHGKEKVALIFLPRDSGDYSQFWDLECHPVEKPSWKHKLRFQLSGIGTKTENKTAIVKASTDTIIGTGLPVIPERKVYSEAPTIKAGSSDITRGVYAPEDLYTFPLTRVGESRTLKVNLRNNSFRTHLLTFLSPKEPFYIKHSKYSLRSHHYINVPVQFKPPAEGVFEALLAVHTSKYGYVNIRLCGKAVAKD